MARIPRADNFQVVPGVRQGRAQAVLSPDQASLPGRRMMAQGEQLMQIGGAVERYALQQQQRVNKIRSDNAFLAFQRDAAVFEQELKQLNGEQAIGAYTLYGDKLQERANELSRDLPGPARDDFLARAGSVQNQFFGIGVQHEAEQLEILETRTLNTRAVSAIEMISLDPTNMTRVDQSREDMRAAYREMFVKAGRTGEDLELAVRTEMGKALKLVIDNLLNDGQYGAASALFERVRKDDMLEVVADDLQSKVNAGAAEERALATIDAMLGIMPNAYDRPADADKWIRENVTNPKELEAARQEWTNRKAVNEQQQKTMRVENYDTALRIANERGLGAARASAAYNSLRPEDQNAIRDYIESRQAVLSARAQNDITQRENNAYNSILAGQTEKYNVATMSQEDFDLYRMTVGETNFIKLRQLRGEMQKDPNKIFSVELDNDLFNTIAAEFGYSPLAKDEATKLELSQLRNRFEKAISIVQQSQQQPLSRDQKEEVMRDAFATGFAPAYVTTRGMFGGQKKVLASEITPEQIARFRYTDIPQSERNEIVRELGRAYNEFTALGQPGPPNLDPGNTDNVIAMYLMRYGVGAEEAE